MPDFTQGTWTAKGAMDAQELGPPKPPKHVVLPGAKAAIGHDELLARHDAGHDSERIVARVNERWETENADRLAEHARWARGPYHDALQKIAEAQAQAAAKEQRRRAIFEQIVSEREG